MSLQFMKILQNIVTNRPKNSNMMLGRWNLINNQNITSVLANMDSCGDKLCGNTDTMRKAIDKYSNKTK